MHWCFAGVVAMSASADTIYLKEKGAVTGTVLAEKKDSVVVDVGYTALVIPRSEISHVALGPVNSSSATNTLQAALSARTEDSPNSLYNTDAQSLGSASVKELAARWGEAVVQVRTPAAIGSGFIINEAGFLITNFHVIEGETQISVEVYHQSKGALERKTYRDVRIIAMNKFQDLALLRIQDKGAPNFKSVTLGRSDALSVGDAVFAIGSPLGLERTVTEGILSTKTRQMSGGLYLQTSAQINPGNSGGPLFNMDGQVVGVTNMKITMGEGLGFAIPVESVRYFLDHRDAYAFSNENPANAYRYLQPPSRTKSQPSISAENAP